MALTGAEVDTGDSFVVLTTCPFVDSNGMAGLGKDDPLPDAGYRELKEKI